uniref:FA complementation group A n=1 Tax=Otus sunia TaxID=257818 RepID=A0A8C8EFM7_9STRI
SQASWTGWHRAPGSIVRIIYRKTWDFCLHSHMFKPFFLPCCQLSALVFFGFFLVSVLQEQASRLGVPTAVLAARNVVTNIERICQASAGPSQVPLLNLDQRKRLSCLLQTVKDLLANNVFCRSLFCQEMWKMKVRTRGEMLPCYRPLRLHLWDVVACFQLSSPTEARDNFYKSAVHPDSLQQFFRHTLTEVLTYNPLLKVSDAIHMQKEWSFTRTCSLLTTLYRKLFVAFSAKDSICQLQQVLETREVNWQHVLSCVSTLVVCQAEAEQLFKDLLSHLLIKAFENYDMENMITAFLIARQAALEGPAVFMPYSEWFKAAFGNAGGRHGSGKKALVFLFEFLSELVPFEAAPYLKVHIMYPPFVPTKHRSILLEYITLAKTRLADLKVSKNCLSEKSSFWICQSTSPQGQALRDVEKALQIFENTRKIPTSVIEASIFRRPYYISWFLPALLRPRVLPKTPDAHMAFIDALKRADKIPSSLYSTYMQACCAMKEKMLQGKKIKTFTHVVFTFCRQGPCLSLFVKMMCGHRNLLPALLGRLCQLIYHQGPSLNDAHVLGLAAFVIHLSESKALIPEVEASFGISQPEKALSVSEYWNRLLVCRTEESFAFCTRFCTAAASYLMCKFSSYSHEDLCALLPPSLVKKLQYLVPRLCLEARGILCEEAKTDLIWSSLSCPSLNYRRASLCLWRQTRFQELLKEKAFQLSFREWLLLELEVYPEKDILSASERQDFHYWAIYQWYLPAPSASGGCDGQLEKACATIINTILDSSQRYSVAHTGRRRLLEPVFCSQWKRLFGAPLAEELERLRGWQSWATRCGRGAQRARRAARGGSRPRRPVLWGRLASGHPLEVISAARRFLLGAIPRCPAQSFGNIQPLLATCEELDPELAAALLRFSRPGVAMELDEELLLF